MRPIELVAALLVMSLIRTLIGVGGAALIAIPLFHYSIFDLGLPLLAFFANLIVMGWAIGLLGFRASCCATDSAPRAWPGSRSSRCSRSAACTTRSRSCPAGCNAVAHGLPSSHVFEGMRAVLIEHRFRMDLLLNAMALNVIYLGAGIAAFLAFFHSARVRGLLLHIGE